MIKSQWCDSNSHADTCTHEVKNLMIDVLQFTTSQFAVIIFLENKKFDIQQKQ